MGPVKDAMTDQGAESAWRRQSGDKAFLFTTVPVEWDLPLTMVGQRRHTILYDTT